MKKVLFPTLITLSMSLSVVSWSYSQGWTSLGGGVPSAVSYMLRYNGKIWAAGDSVYNWNGTSWTSVGTGMLYPLGVGSIYSLAVFNNALFAGGFFTVLTPDNDWYNNVGRLSNDSWTTCGTGTGNDGSAMNDYVDFLTVYAGSLYAGGNFTSAGGDPSFPQDAMYIARFDGSQWYPVGGGTNDRITDMVVYNNKLVVSGYFTSAGGAGANHIAAWDGTKWDSLGSGTDGQVTALGVHDGYLYAGGMFTEAGGVPAANIARWDGQSWSAVGDGLMGPVYTIASWNGKLYAGGYDLQKIFLSTPPYEIEQHIMCWDGSKWDSLQAGTDGAVYWLFADSLGLIAGGSFTTAGDDSSSNIALYTTTTPVKEPAQQPREYSLWQNYPNPFNPTTKIEFQIADVGFVTLRVYDVLGREVKTLINKAEQPGNYSVTFNAADLPSGVYFYRLTTETFTDTKKMLYIK